MNYLLAGCESKERVAMLLDFTKISSEPLIKAIHARLVNGKTESLAAILCDVPQQNLSRAMIAIDIVAGKVEKIKAHDWAHLDWDKFNKSVK